MTLRCAFSPSQTSKTYRKLKRECLKQGKLFIDSEFPPSNESLFLDESRWSGADLEIEWKRPGEIVDDPRLFVEGASPFDVTQGILGNCWFVSACSALTNSEALLCKVIPDGQEWDSTSNDYAGIFQFCFWRFGRWIDVIIDDLLPCRSGKLLFARSKTDNEFWSALLEKAFAKFYGCYENLVGGQLADALQDVSGGVAETLNVHRFISQHKKILNGTNSTEDLHLSKRLNNLANGNLTSLSVYKTGISASKRLFYTLKHAFNREALIVAAISVFSEINICFVLEIDSNLIG
uniref:Calpain catalytic domain-containing protein n=1 Tax=Meloidogyne incognita TaxID=6306 RepID=A0A914MW76_MELIC